MFNELFIHFTGYIILHIYYTGFIITIQVIQNILYII